MIISGYTFSEPKQINAADNIERAAIYIVMTHNSQSWHYLYVGQTNDVAKRFDQHEKWSCWQRNQQSGGLFVAILLESNKDKRLAIETQLRNGLPVLPCNRQ